ncbi:TadE-like protein [Demequina pelophila]|uniref:TadE-like protein n=1 Tax=Demequina pelophila TaxID=1638984 RepID=UPI0012E078B0|nr:TadE-like protein [Demequina pelophila]
MAGIVAAFGLALALLAGAIGEASQRARAQQAADAAALAGAWAARAGLVLIEAGGATPCATAGGAAAAADATVESCTVSGRVRVEVRVRHGPASATAVAGMRSAGAAP